MITAHDTRIYIVDKVSGALAEIGAKVASLRISRSGDRGMGQPVPKMAPVDMSVNFDKLTPDQMTPVTKHIAAAFQQMGEAGQSAADAIAGLKEPLERLLEVQRAFNASVEDGEQALDALEDELGTPPEVRETLRAVCFGKIPE